MGIREIRGARAEGERRQAGKGHVHYQYDDWGPASSIIMHTITFTKRRELPSVLTITQTTDNDRYRHRQDLNHRGL